MERDFWGKLKARKLDNLERGLKRYDAVSFPDRLKRLRIMAKVVSSPSGYLLNSIDCGFLFADAKNCFISGQFAACILVCQALLEHHLKGMYRTQDSHTTRTNFQQLIEQTLADQVLPEFLTLKLNELRRNRNPLVHMSHDTMGFYARRAIKENTSPEELLEQDAKDAILLTFEILNRLPFSL